MWWLRSYKKIYTSEIFDMKYAYYHSNKTCLILLYYKSQINNTCNNYEAFKVSSLFNKT